MQRLFTTSWCHCSFVLQDPVKSPEDVAESADSANVADSAGVAAVPDAIAAMIDADIEPRDHDNDDDD